MGTIPKRLSSTLLLLLATSSVHAGDNPASRNFVLAEVAKLKQYVRDYVASTVTYKIGDNAQGGVVFWVDETGQHGLVAALEDISGPILNPQLTSAFTSPALGGSGSGYMNTAVIMSVVSTLGTTPVGGSEPTTYTSVASDVSDLITNYTGQDNYSDCNGDLTPSANAACYNGWYVPSRGEMQLMVAGLCNVDASTIPDYTALLTQQNYWTSNVNYSNATALVVAYTQTGTIPNASCTGTTTTVGVTTTNPVRPVRQF